MGEMWIVNVNGQEWTRVLANTERDAYDLAEKIWDAEHGNGDFDKQTVGIVMVLTIWTPAVEK